MDDAVFLVEFWHIVVVRELSAEPVIHILAGMLLALGGPAHGIEFIHHHIRVIQKGDILCHHQEGQQGLLVFGGLVEAAERAVVLLAAASGLQDDVEAHLLKLAVKLELGSVDLAGVLKESLGNGDGVGEVVDFVAVVLAHCFYFLSSLSFCGFIIAIILLRNSDSHQISSFSFAAFFAASLAAFSASCLAQSFLNSSS